METLIKPTGASLNRGGSRQDYETPPDFISAVEKRFGVINCDLAARADNTKGQTWFDESRDSLTVDWHETRGNLWLNPPFDNIAPWAEKCALESEKGAKILFLTPASVGSNWFSSFVFNKAHVLFLNKRLTFVGLRMLTQRIASFHVMVSENRVLRYGGGNENNQKIILQAASESCNPVRPAINRNIETKEKRFE